MANPKKSKEIVNNKKKNDAIATNKPSANWPWWVAAGIFAVTTLIFFWSHLSGSSFFWEDFTEQVYPIQCFAACSSAEGETPFWNPYTFSGMPFYDDLQVGYWYPFNRLLTYFVSDGHLPVGALQFMIILHFFIAQFSMYKLMRHWKVSAPGGIIAALGYGFSFSLVLHAFHPMIVYHLAWFPLVLMFFLKGIEGGRLSCSIVGGAIFGMSLLAGHPQSLLYESLFLGLMFIWYIITALRAKESKIGIKIAAGIIPFVVGIGIFSVQYLPSQEFASLSARSEFTYEQASEGSMGPGQLFTSVVPDLYGSSSAKRDDVVPFHKEGAGYYYYWDTGFYFGATILLLGLIALFARQGGRAWGFLLFIGVFGILYSLGDNFVLHKAFYNLPFFGLLRMPARMMFYLVLAMSAFAGFGFDYLSKGISANTLKLIYIAAAIPIGLALLTLIGMIPGIIKTPDQFSSAVQGFGALPLFLGLIVFVLAYLMGKGKLSSVVAGSVIIVIVFADLYIAGSDFNQSDQNPEQRYEIHPEMQQAFAAKLPDDLFRVSMRHYNPSYMAMARNQGLMSGIMLIEGYNQMILKHLSIPVDDRQTIHDLHNVRYEINYVPEQRNFTWTNRPNALPHAFIVYNYEVMNPEQMEQTMRAGTTNYRKTVLLEKAPSFATLPDSLDIDNTVKCLKYENNFIHYNVETKKDGLLVLSEIWYPAWKAYIDGKEIDIHKANWAFRAIEVGAGKHDIEFKYESSAYASGKIISIITLLLAIAGIILLRKQGLNTDGMAKQ